MEKLWTTAEVASYLGVGHDQVEALVREGKLTAYKLGGQFLRFRPDQVEALQAMLRIDPAARRKASHPAESRLDRLRDFVYFHDFYLACAVLLACVIVYLIAFD
ncbi:MAG TPA: excisionase family DNA-binding protein [bacterium]